MPPDDATRLRYMLDAAQEAVAYCRGMDEDSFKNDLRTVRAVMFCLGVIGENVPHLSPDTLSRFPEIPWHAIRGMRNRIAHEYFDINVSVVWSTVTENLPPFIRALTAEMDPPK